MHNKGHYKSLDFLIVGEFIGKTVKGDMEFLTMEKELKEVTSCQ